MKTGIDDGEATGRLRLDPRSVRSLRLFSTRPGAPRSRRPTDSILLVLNSLLLLIACWSVEPPGSLSDDLLLVVEDSPDWLLSIWLVLFEVMLVWSVLLVLLALVRRHFISALAAVGSAVLGLVIAFVAQRLVIDDALAAGDFARQFTASEGPPEFPGIRLLAAAAVLVVLSPALTRPFRFFGRIVLVLGFLATVGLGVATLAGAIGGLAAGIAAAAAVHLLIGSPGGRPSRHEIRLVLADLGIPVRELQPASLEPAGVVLMDATHADGRALAVKVYGRDAWDGQFLNKFWRSLWYRDSRSTLFLSRLHQVEHEALVTLLAQRAGTPVPDVLVAGEASGDAAMVTTAGGTPLAGRMTDGPGVPDATIVELWDAVGTAHQAGIVHGALDLHTVTVDGDDALLLVDWSRASVAASQGAVDAERAQLLVLSALAVGGDRAVAIAGDALGPTDLERVVPYIQNPALNTGLRRDVNAQDLDLDELRDATAGSLDVDQVELVELRRVTFKSVASIVLVGIAAMLLISSLSDIGIETIIDELSSASWGWVLIALITAQAARFWTGLGTTGATDHPLRLGPTVVLEFAITFVNLVIPSSAARFATKMRYFQRAGMTLTSATAMGAIDSIAGFFVQITVLLSAILFGLGGIEFDVDVDTDSVQRLATLVGILVVVAIVAGVLVLVFVPKVRERVLDAVRQVRAALRVVRSPSRLLRLLGGNAMAELTFAAVLFFSLLAYGETASIVSLLVINVAVALLAGIVPVPGGIGVTEAALTAGLVAIGVPEATAFAAAITTRLCTFYLPPIWGYFAMRWLRENNYL